MYEKGTQFKLTKVTALIITSCGPIGHFRYIKIQLDDEAWRTQTKEMNKHMVIQFPKCLCPVSANLAPVVRRLVNAIDQINRYPVDKS